MAGRRCGSFFQTAASSSSSPTRFSSLIASFYSLFNYLIIMLLQNNQCSTSCLKHHRQTSHPSQGRRSIGLLAVARLLNTTCRPIRRLGRTVCFQVDLQKLHLFLQVRLRVCLPEVGVQLFFLIPLPPSMLALPFKLITPLD